MSVCSFEEYNMKGVATIEDLVAEIQLRLLWLISVAGRESGCGFSAGCGGCGGKWHDAHYCKEMSTGSQS